MFGLVDPPLKVSRLFPGPNFLDFAKIDAAQDVVDAVGARPNELASFQIYLQINVSVVCWIFYLEAKPAIR